MKSALQEFAVAGGDPAFDDGLPVGQLWFSGWDRYQAAMEGILERQYYTNHGPLIRELEANLEQYLGVRNAVTVTNATLGLYLVAIGLGLRGKVMMPAFSFIATAQAAVLADLEPVFCDVDPETHQMTVETAEKALVDGVSAVCPVSLWGNAVDIPGLTSWARSHDLKIFYDSAHAFGASTSEGRIGRFGDAEVFSFHATKVMSSAEGGCVCTDDDDLAERIRNMRSNYGIRRPLPVLLTVNARMSEAQGAVGLMSLEDVGERIAANRATFEAYRGVLADQAGIRLLEPTGVTESNYQNVVVDVDEQRFGMSRDGLWRMLRAEGVLARRYFKPGIHRSTPFDERYPQFVDALPVTDGLCESVMQLPVGAFVTPDAAERIAGLIAAAHRHAEGLNACA